MPIRRTSTYALTVHEEELAAGTGYNHFLGQTHVDLIRTRWWQWRDRIWRQRNNYVCVHALTSPARHRATA